MDEVRRNGSRHPPSPSLTLTLTLQAITQSQSGGTIVTLSVFATFTRICWLTFGPQLPEIRCHDSADFPTACCHTRRTRAFGTNLLSAPDSALMNTAKLNHAWAIWGHRSSARRATPASKQVVDHSSCDEGFVSMLPSSSSNSAQSRAAGPGKGESPWGMQKTSAASAG